MPAHQVTVARHRRRPFRASRATCYSDRSSTNCSNLSSHRRSSPGSSTDWSMTIARVSAVASRWLCSDRRTATSILRRRADDSPWRPPRHRHSLPTRVIWLTWFCSVGAPEQVERSLDPLRTSNRTDWHRSRRYSPASQGRDRAVWPVVCPARQPDHPTDGAHCPPLTRLPWQFMRTTAAALPVLRARSVRSDQ